MWDEIYSDQEYVYGTQANDFLRESYPQLKQGKALCLADGEGRNSVFLAEHGFEVTGIDASAVGLEKASRLAAERGVQLKTIHMDLNEYAIEPDAWDTIVSVFCHLPRPLRQKVHAQAVQGLRAGGTFLLEAYTPEQLQFGTGGPPVAEMMMSLDKLQDELKGLEFLHARELERDVVEGSKHTGRAAVVQILARKP